MKTEDAGLHPHSLIGWSGISPRNGIVNKSLVNVNATGQGTIV